jgi:transposase
MHVRSNEQAKAAATLCGIGPVTASALVATVDDFKQFKNGRQFSAWMGPGAQAELERRQERAGRDHQARRRIPAKRS